MNKSHKISLIASGICFLLFISTNYALGQKTNSSRKTIINDASTLSGDWYCETTELTFALHLTQTKDSIHGYYCAKYNKGARIDCDDSHINCILEGTIQNGVATLFFNSAFSETNDFDTARIRLTQEKKILVWCSKKKAIISYVPAHAKLDKTSIKESKRSK